MSRLHDLEQLTITGAAGTRYYGGNQEWYSTLWQRRSGCGPTSCSNLMLYLGRTREHLSPLLPENAGSKSGFLTLMEQVWHFVTPTRMGVNSTAIFTEGAERFAADRGIRLQAQVLEISPVPFKRPAPERLLEFLRDAFDRDLPVAFLNLSNGALRNLDNWHWVTLVGVEDDLRATMYDQGIRSVIDLALWLRTTSLGGGFVVLQP